MSNFTPPSGKNVLKSVSLFLLLLIFFGAYMRGYQAGMCSSDFGNNTCGAACGTAEPRPVELTRSLFYNPDSMAYYAAVAEVKDDPRALFIAGMAAHLALADPDYPKDIPTVPFPDADYYLLLAAELGNADAITYIRCLDAHGCWHYFIPQEKK